MADGLQYQIPINNCKKKKKKLQGVFKVKSINYNMP